MIALSNDLLRELLLQFNSLHVADLVFGDGMSFQSPAVTCGSQEWLIHMISTKAIACACDIVLGRLSCCIELLSAY